MWTVILNIPCQHQTLHQPAFVWWTPNSTFPQSCLSPSTAKDVAKGRPPDSCLAHTSLLSATCVWSQTNWKIIYLQWIVQIKDTKQQNLRGLNPVGMNSSYRVHIIDLMIHPLMCKTWNQLHLRWTQKLKASPNLARSRYACHPSVRMTLPVSTCLVISSSKTSFVLLPPGHSQTKISPVSLLHNFWWIKLCKTLRHTKTIK